MRTLLLAPFTPTRRGSTPKQSSFSATYRQVRSHASMDSHYCFSSPFTVIRPVHLSEVRVGRSNSNRMAECLEVCWCANAAANDLYRESVIRGGFHLPETALLSLHPILPSSGLLCMLCGVCPWSRRGPSGDICSFASVVIGSGLVTRYFSGSHRSFVTHDACAQ